MGKVHSTKTAAIGRKDSGASGLPWGHALVPPLLTFLFYLPVLGNGFINYDDPPFIAENTHIRLLDPAFFQWAFTTFYRGNWMPLSWLSLALDYALGGLNPSVYHLHSLLLHCANTLLVFLFARKFLSLPSVPRLPVEPAACLAALLFGLHPLHVESVAWACEQRDVLCAFFYLLSLLFYLEAAGKPGWGHWPLWACLGSFLLALMSKPMAVTLPLALVLLDAWPLKRSWAGRGGLLEKTPFFFLSLVLALTAFRAQQSAGALSDTDAVPIGMRIANAFHSIAFYIYKLAFPLDLHPFYPFKKSSVLFLSPWVLAAIGLVVAFSAACLHRRLGNPWLGTAWLYYLLTLLPVLGLVQTGSQAAADRFTYLPSLGPFLLASGGLAWFWKAQRPVLLPALGLLALFLGPLSFRQTGVWKDSISLWENVAEAYPGPSYLPHFNLGEAYFQAGRFPEALREADKAVGLAPNRANCHTGRGVALAMLGRKDEAVLEFQKAAALDPADPRPHVNLSAAYQDLGERAEALAELRLVARLDPGWPGLRERMAALSSGGGV